MSPKKKGKRSRDCNKQTEKSRVFFISLFGHTVCNLPSTYCRFYALILMILRYNLSTVRERNGGLTLINNVLHTNNNKILTLRTLDLNLKKWSLLQNKRPGWRLTESLRLKRKGWQNRRLLLLRFYLHSLLFRAHQVHSLLLHKALLLHPHLLHLLPLRHRHHHLPQQTPTQQQNIREQRKKTPLLTPVLLFAFTVT